MKNGSMPAADKLAKIAAYIGVTTDYLLTGKETKLYVAENDTKNDNENDFMEIGKESREALKLLGDMFILLKQNFDKNKATYMELGITREQMSDWSEFEFFENPSIPQLKGMLEILSAYYTNE